MKWNYLTEEYKKKVMDNMKLCDLCNYPEFDLDDAIFHQETKFHKGHGINTHNRYIPGSKEEDYKYHLKVVELFNLGSKEDLKIINEAREKEYADDKTIIIEQSAR